MPRAGRAAFTGNRLLTRAALLSDQSRDGYEAVQDVKRAKEGSCPRAPIHILLWLGRPNRDRD